MAHFRRSLIHAVPQYHRQCYSIINRYISSDALFDEINASLKKIKQSKPSLTISDKSINKSKPKKETKTKINDRSNPNNKQLIHKSVSLIKSPNTLNQRKNDYLSHLKPTKSIFDKFGLYELRNFSQMTYIQSQYTESTASELEKQRKESTNHRPKKENIDHYIKKEIEFKQKQKKQRFEDPIFSELDHYDMSLSELVSTQNITKHKTKSDEIIKYDQNTANLIESELNLSEHQNENENISFNELIATNQNDRKRELMKAIDWTKLENYIELNGWNKFAQFLNNSESQTTIQKYSIPSFLSQIPQKRKKLNRPKAKTLGNETNALKQYKINQKVLFEPFKFQQNGNVSVLVNNKHSGFIKRHNLPIDIQIGEFHTGYVYEINYFGKIEVIMEKPNFWSRMSECQRRIIAVLKYCNGSVEISDKAEPEIIRKMFEMSKKNFKKALGMLMKNGVVEIFNESDVDVPSKIVLNRQKIDLQRYDVGKEVEKRMWQSKPIWEYGVDAPPFADVLPDEIKERNKKANETYEKKQSLRKFK